MKIGVKFNQSTYAEYFHVIEYHHKYTDFNNLGWYRLVAIDSRLILNAG
jgi:hypothetical protein